MLLLPYNGYEFYMASIDKVFSEPLGEVGDFNFDDKVAEVF